MINEVMVHNGTMIIDGYNLTELEEVVLYRLQVLIDAKHSDNSILFWNRTIANSEFEFNFQKAFSNYKKYCKKHDFKISTKEQFIEVICRHRLLDLVETVHHKLVFILTENYDELFELIMDVQRKTNI